MHAVAAGCCFKKIVGKGELAQENCLLDGGRGGHFLFYFSFFRVLAAKKKKEEEQRPFLFLSVIVWGTQRSAALKTRPVLFHPPPKRKAFVGAPRTTAGDLVMGGFKNGGNGAQNAFSFASLLRSNDVWVGVEEKGSIPTEFITLSRITQSVQKTGRQSLQNFYALPAAFK